MSEEYSLTETLSLHKTEAEWLFSGAVFLSAEYALESCGWLKPESISEPRIRRFWELVKAGCDPAQSAIEAGIYLDVVRSMNQIASYFDVTSFADTISLDEFLYRSAVQLSDMARAISRREYETLRKQAQEIAEAAPGTGNRLPNAVDIGLDFHSSLEDVGSLVIPTGIATLDRNMGGYERATLVIVGGRPGMGKTSFGLQSAVENARAGRRVIYFSLEMSRRDLWSRLACGKAGVDWRKIKSKTASAAEVERVDQASASWMDALEDRFIVNDAPMTTSEDIFRQVAEYKPNLIVVDHLDLVDRKDRGKLSEVIRVGNISRMGKVIAKQFDIPAVYLMQLNRGTEERADKRPVLSDIRASGEVEQDADVVAFLYRPDYYDREKRVDTIVDCEIWLEKVRNGQSGIKVETKLNLLQQWFYAIDRKSSAADLELSEE